MFVSLLTALRFTAAGAPPDARRIGIMPMNQYVWSTEPWICQQKIRTTVYLQLLPIHNLSIAEFSPVTHEQNWSYSYTNAQNLHANLWVAFHLVAGVYT
jgi:hypothetical protein